MSDLKVALELQASVGQFLSAVKKASGSFDASLQSMQTTAAATGSRVEASMEKVGIRRHREINADIKSVERAYEQLAASGQLTERELAQASVKMRERVRELRSETNGWAQSLDAMKGELALAAAGIFATVRTLGRATKASSEFQTALAEITTLNFDGAIGDLRREIEQLSLTYGGDVITNANAAYDIISAGASNAADAIDQLTASNRLAVGGKTDVATAASGVSSILAAYGDAAGGAANVTDALFVAMQGGKTTIGELSNSIGDVTGLAQAAGLGLDEMLSAASALSIAAGSTSKGVTQLRGIISAIIKPTAEARDEAERLGIQFDTAAIRTQGFAAWLEDLREKTGGNEAALGRLFGNIEGLNGALQLTGEGAENFNSILDQMENKAGATETAVGQMFETPELRAAKFEQQMASVQRSLGDAVTAFSPLLDVLSGLLSGFNDLEPSTRAVIAGLGGAAGAAIALAPAISSLVRVVALLRTGIILATGSTALHTKAIQANTGAAAANVGALGRLAGLLRGLPYVALAGAIGQAVVAFNELRESQREAAEAEAELQEGSERLAARLAEVSAQTGIAFDSMEDLRQAVEDGVIVFNEANGEWRAAVQAQSDLADQGERTTRVFSEQEQAMVDHYQSLIESANAAGALSDALEQIDPSAEGAADQVAALISQLDLADARDLRALRLALGDLGSEAEGVAALVQEQLIERIKEADGQTLSSLIAEVNRLKASGQDAGSALEGMASTALAESFRRLGLTIETELGKVSPAAQRAISAVDGIVAGIDSLGLSAEQESDVIESALSSAFDMADNEASLKAIQQRMQDLANEGKLTSQDYADLKVQFEEAMAALAGGQDQAKKQNDKTTQSLREQTAATKELTAANEEKEESERRSRSVAISHAAILERVGFSSKEAASASEIYAETLARVRRETAADVNGLPSYIAWLNGSREAALQAAERFRDLERSIAGVERQMSSSASRTSELELQLLELSATEEEVAIARAQREREQIELEIRRNGLLAERARMSGDDAQVDQYLRENAELRKQLDLMDQIAAKEQARRQETKRAEQEAKQRQQQEATQPQPGPSDTGTGGASPQRAAGLPSRTVTIQIDGTNARATVDESAEDDVIDLIRTAAERAA
jgi:TP901 family phage tail tape measure protein